jgi:hypothetical protein
MQDTSVSRWVYAGYSLLLPAGGLMQYAPVCGWVYAGYSCQPMANAGYSWQQMDLCRILLSADEFMQDSPASRWVHAVCSRQLMGLCSMLPSADGFMQDTPVSSWVSA